MPPRMWRVAGPPGGGKPKALPVSNFGVGYFNADDQAAAPAPDAQFNLFADFNGLPSEEARTEFYQHDANWTNRMILGDSLQVMASLAEREGLRGPVQRIHFDPP
jgi:hypothetical protein